MSAPGRNRACPLALRRRSAVLSESKSQAWRRASELHRTVTRLQRAQLNLELHVMVRETGFEPVRAVWKTAVLPLNTTLAWSRIPESNRNRTDTNGEHDLRADAALLVRQVRKELHLVPKFWRLRCDFRSDLSRCLRESNPPRLLDREVATPVASGSSYRALVANRTRWHRLRRPRTESIGESNRVTYGFRSRRWRIHSASGSPAPSRHSLGGENRTPLVSVPNGVPHQSATPKEEVFTSHCVDTLGFAPSPPRLQRGATTRSAWCPVARMGFEPILSV